MTLDYFYGQSGELFSYFRIPRHTFELILSDSHPAAWFGRDILAFSPAVGYTDGVRGRSYIFKWMQRYSSLNKQ